MSRDEVYEYELTATRAETATVLSDVAAGLLAGSVRLGDGPDAVAVDVPEEVELEVEFETDEDGTSLEVEMEWPHSNGDESAAPVENQPEASDEQPAPVGTSDEQPAPVGTSDEQPAPVEASDEQPAPVEAADEQSTPVEVADEQSTPVEVADEPPIPVGAADGSESAARFELFRDRADEWRWRLRHRNGNVIATSGEGYTRKHNARKGLRSVVRNAPDAPVEEDR